MVREWYIVKRRWRGGRLEDGKEEKHERKVRENIYFPNWNSFLFESFIRKEDVLMT
jgi:hypothetical protein